MDISRRPCRLCLSVSEFNVSLFGNYCRNTGMLDKILVCLKILVEESDYLHTICYKCADSVEKFYDFTTFVKKSQAKLCGNEKRDSNSKDRLHLTNFNSYAHSRVIEPDIFSVLEVSVCIDEKKETKASSPYFNYFSPPNVVQKQSEPSVWKTPRPRCSGDVQNSKKKSRFERQKLDKPRQLSRDLFESQSQETEEAEAKCLDWKLSSEENTIRRVREKCFGPSDFC